MEEGEVKMVSAQLHEQVLSTEIEDIAVAERVYCCVEFRSSKLFVSFAIVLVVRGALVLKRPTLVILAGLVLSVCKMRDGNRVVLAAPKTEQLHLHLGVKVLVEKRNLVAVVVIPVDASAADDDGVVKWAFVRVIGNKAFAVSHNGAEVAKTLSDKRVVSLCATLLLRNDTDVCSDCGG